MRNASIKKILEIGKVDERIVFLSVDQPTGFDTELEKNLKQRFLKEPISESNVIGMAAGLASEGYIPYVFNHATFNSRRCYEQIMLDASLQNFNIKLISMGAGLSTSHLGPTHTSFDDIALMRLIPNMCVLVPSNAEEVAKLIPQTINLKKSIYIRLTKFGIPKYGVSPDSKIIQKVKIGKPQLVYKNHNNSKNDILIISNGALTPIAIEVAINFQKQVNTSVLNVTTVKPLDCNILYEHVKKSKNIFVVEEHSKIGGLGSACLEVLVDNYGIENLKPIYRLGLDDKFIHKYGDQEQVLRYCKLMPNQIEKQILERI